jgi:predicted kinase
VADLLDTAARTRADKEARRENIRALARERRLDELAHGEEKAWARIDTMIATKKPGEYDAAVMLLTELRALAERDGRPDEFARRSIALRQTHSRKPSLIERFNRAGI